MTRDLRQELSHVYWIGGSPCSGKSRIADLFANRYALRIYHWDEAFNEHQKRITPLEQPTIYKLLRMTWDEMWMRPVDVLLREAILAYGEQFEMALQDLLALPKSPPILAEGTALLPSCVSPLLGSPRQAIWIVPTEAFQRERYPLRGEWVQQILKQCERPDEALQNWMDRDAAYARWISRETERLDLKLLRVDGTRTIAETAAIAATHLRLGAPERDFE